MATQRTSFTKLQRDRAKKAKAAAKRERRLERAAEARNPTDDADGFEASAEGPISAAELLHEIEVTHQRFEAKLISYEEFEEKKAELLSRLPID
ncbi:MAG TPA: hypothetical protein VKX24_12120 [Acidimicrobiia bacterium]|nr:hypothetical protein [Acidimicrobiia bacterium]HZQ76820.1 hypothetical protein [Acidimicrobiia bacterium]